MQTTEQTPNKTNPANQPARTVKGIDKFKYFEAIGYKPHSPEQASFHKSTARFRVAVCGRRFGKSSMAAKDREPELLLPNKRFWIVGPNYDLGEKEFRVIWNDLMIGKELLRDKRVKRAYNKKQGEMFIEFPWQTRLEVRSAQHPESLVGDALHGVIMSEAARHDPDTWEKYIRPALADYTGWADFVSTPMGQNWLYGLWQNGRNPEYKGIYQSWNFPSWLNTVLFPLGINDPEILLMRKSMGKEEFEQEIAANFTSFKGKIYHEFDENVHVKSAEYNPAWPNYITFDFGYTNPLAAIEFQVTPWDEVRIWREHYKSYMMLEDHLAEMKARVQPAGYKIDLCFGDPADPEAIQYINTHFAPCMGDMNCKTNWREGIDLVKSFLKLRDTGSKDDYERPIEVPGLVIDHSCTNTIYEFNNYKVKTSTQTAPDKRESNTTGASTKKDDHAVDAVRYALMHLFVLGAQSHLSDTVPSKSVWQENSGSGPDTGYFTTSGMQF